MVFQRSLGQGKTLYASTETAIADESGLAGAAAGLDWAVIDVGDTLHVHLAPGAALPPGLGGPTPLWELAASLTGPQDATLAIASGPALDAAAVLVPLGAPALAEATALARLPVPALDDGPNAAWDRLAPIARRAQALARDRRLLAAALTYKGRGRLIGPIAGDLLLRFGVSTWR